MVCVKALTVLVNAEEALRARASSAPDKITPSRSTALPIFPTHGKMTLAPVYAILFVKELLTAASSRHHFAEADIGGGEMKSLDAEFGEAVRAADITIPARMRFEAMPSLSSLWLALLATSRTFVFRECKSSRWTRQEARRAMATWHN